MAQFKVGDKVRLVKAREDFTKSNEPGWSNSWKPTMTEHVKRKAEGVITGIHHSGIYTSIDWYGYPPDSFELVQPAIDWDKPLQTRGGDPVTIITREGRGKFSVIGYIGAGDETAIWLSDGRFYNNREPDYRDIINVPEKPIQKEVWFNVFKEEGTLRTGHRFYTRQEADDSPVSEDRVGCIKVVLTEGQFDN